MPFLDVSDVLSDPDFATTITVTRSVETPPVGGFTQITTSNSPGIVAVVEPATSNDLVRMPEAESLTGNIAIYTTFWLIAKAPGHSADIVTWRGRTYTVQAVDDWTEFGAGYVRALAAMTSLA